MLVIGLHLRPAASEVVRRMRRRIASSARNTMRTATAISSLTRLRNRLHRVLVAEEACAARRSTSSSRRLMLPLFRQAGQQNLHMTMGETSVFFNCRATRSAAKSFRPRCRPSRERICGASRARNFASPRERPRSDSHSTIAAEKSTSPSLSRHRLGREEILLYERRRDCRRCGPGCCGMIAVCGIGRPIGRRNSATTAYQSASPPIIAASAKAATSTRDGHVVHRRRGSPIKNERNTPTSAEVATILMRRSSSSLRRSCGGQRDGHEDRSPPLRGARARRLRFPSDIRS